MMLPQEVLFEHRNKNYFAVWAQGQVTKSHGISNPGGTQKSSGGGSGQLALGDPA